jgi:hypothetical protein
LDRVSVMYHSSLTDVAWHMTCGVAHSATCEIFFDMWHDTWHDTWRDMWRDTWRDTWRDITAWLSYLDKIANLFCHLSTIQTKLDSDPKFFL